jgi:FxsC-like protein
VSQTYSSAAPYFFLSYPRIDPLAGNPDENPDQLVETFFGDLTHAVKRHATGGGDGVSGFYDRAIPVGSDLEKLTTKALSAAQVFVPLYSVAYLNNSWPGRELTCFRKRVEQAGRDNPEGRFVPVLWTPLAGVKDPPGLRESLAHRVTVPDYADNGLRVLLKLPSYHDSYRAVIDRLAVQIVELAERDPIEPVEPSRVGDVAKARSEFPASRPLPVFNVEIFAPTSESAPPGRDPRAYGATPAQWRPFPVQQVTLAEHARQLIEPFDFDVRVGAATGVAARRPGIIMIDPTFIAEDAGRDSLRAIAEALPRWVLPLVVVAPDDAPTRALAAGVLDILAKAKALPAERSGKAAHGIYSLDDFVSTVPVLVAEAERQYFRSRDRRVLPSQAAQRPSLRQPEGPDGAAAAADP